jgi:MYXO-CTERM domain-containing protein
MAQPNTGGSISDLNAAFTQGDSPLVGTGPGPIAASFQVGGAGNPDHLGASWWWTRTTAANTRELANNSATSSNWPAGGAGRVGQLSFNDPGSGISIVRTYLVTGLGDGRGVLEEGATVTNTTGSTLTVNLFHFLDPTLGGAAGGITAELNGLTNIRLTSGNFTAFYEGSGNAFQAGQAGIILSLLTNGVADNFTSGPMPPPGDIEAGFQWQFVLGPGQAASASMTYTVVPTPGSLALLGMAGAVAGRRRR